MHNIRKILKVYFNSLSFQKTIHKTEISYQQTGKLNKFMEGGVDKKLKDKYQLLIQTE